MSVATYTKSGAAAPTPAKLDKAVFAVEVTNHETLKAAYVAFQANERQNLALTLKRGQVSGGGKKPWKQKGTGRARFGSSRNPIWRGGGIAFGPTGNENYSKKLTTASKRRALRQALSLAATANKISVIEDISITSGKTKDATALLKKLNAQRKVVIVVDNKDESLVRATKNIADVVIKQPKYLNTALVLDADTIIFTKSTLQTTTEWLKEKVS